MAAFAEADLDERVRTGRVACLLVVFLMPAGSLLDWFVYRADAAVFLWWRLLCSALVAGLLGLHGVSWSRHWLRPLSSLIALLPAAFISLMIRRNEGWDSPYYAGLCLILLAINVVVHWSFVESLLTSVLIIGMYVWAAQAHGGTPHEGIQFNNLYFLIVTALTVPTGNFVYNRLRRSEFLAQRELERSQTELERTNHRLREMAELKGRFFANISHELRPPLTLVLAPLENLRQHPALRDPALRDCIETMHGNSMRLLKLINDLLELVRLDAGRMRLHRSRLDVLSFLQGTLNSIRPFAEDRGLRLTLHVEPGLEHLMADPDKLEKVFLNLLFNAVKFTPGGGTIQVRARVEAAQAVFEVSDTGMGIATEDLQHLFSRFWQADTSSQRKFQGAGIGLALVKELVEAHGGSVAAESQAGKGTLFRIALPLQTPDPADPLAEREAETEEVQAVTLAAEAPPAARTTEAQAAWLSSLYRRAELFGGPTPLKNMVHSAVPPSHGQKPRVLVVDDEPDMLRFVRTLLVHDYDVIEASDGDQAVTLTRQYLPDVVVCDLMLPGKDGMAVCRELRQSEGTRGIPVIMLTARADDATKLDALGAGVNDFLSKPFSIAELHVRVRNLCDGHLMARTLARQKQTLEATLETLRETELQLVQTEKLASLGRMSAGIIHEINNPLNFSLTALTILARQAKDLPAAAQADYTETLDDIQEGLRRVAKIVADLREFTHPQGGALETVEVNAALNTALRFLAAEWKEKVQIDNRVPPDFAVRAVSGKLMQVFVNLIQNSLDALRSKVFPPGTSPLIRFDSRVGGGVKTIVIWDNGPGVPAHHLPKVFDPFFTTKEVGKGTGLGLSICFRLLEEVGARISLRSEENLFCEFSLDFPAGDEEAGAQSHTITTAVA